MRCPSVAVSMASYGHKMMSGRGSHQEEPRQRSSEEDLEVLPLLVVVTKVLPRRLGDFELVPGLGIIRHARNLVNLGLSPYSSTVRVNIRSRLLHVALNIECITGSLGDSEADYLMSVATSTSDVSRRNYSQYKAMAPGTQPQPTKRRHILSTDCTQGKVVEQVLGLVAVASESLKPAVAIRSMRPAMSWPMPCMAKTAFIMKPRHLVVANSDVMMAERG